MDHAYIEENGLVELYHRGLLEPEEEARFEEHFVDCARCAEQLELARGFQKGLKAMAAEDAARAVIQAGLFAWLARRARLAQWGLALAVLLLAAGLPSFWLLNRGREEDQTAAARLETERRNAADLQRRLSESERRRSEERRELEGRIAAARPPQPAETPRGLAGPLVNTPVFLLTAVRGGEERPATVDASRSGDALALAVDVGPDAGFASYRAAILKAGGAAVFQRSGLKPNALEALMITFPASFFAPGDWLRVEGVRPDGSASEIGVYPFTVKGKD
jgi:hypothetical protein